jgi:hypothetical protein
VCAEKYEEHPSWGMVEFSRVEHGGTCRLFGSNLTNHGTTIMLRVWQAHRKHDLGQDWIHGGSRELIEVEMSAAQFAGLLTTMNIGNGVPCTIRHVQGEQRPEVPPDPGEMGRIRAAFRREIEGDDSERSGHGGLTTRLRDLMDEAKKVLSKDGTVKVSERKALLDRLEMLEQEIRANMPFMLKQFERATEKVATAAKAEVDAFITHAATRLGMERLRELATGGGGLALPDDRTPALPGAGVNPTKEEK